MDANALFGNWRTTLAGFVASVIIYFNQVGVNLPTNRDELRTTLIAALVAWLGAVAKDAKTGSQAR